MLWLLRTASLVTGLLLTILFGLYTVTLPPGATIPGPCVLVDFARVPDQWKKAT
ncbi:unnamed protein product [Cercospora beticola]|nr:unnamed protein product [Cercospora beticola]